MTQGQRLAPPDPGAYTPRQKEIHDAIAGGPRGGVRGPLAVWLHRPELAAAAQALGRYCRYDTLLPPHLSELAILVTASAWKAEYEWAAHAPIALKAGVPEAAIEAIRRGERPDLPDETMAATHAFAVEMTASRQVSDANYARAAAALGKEGVVDLVGILGYYGLISATLNAFRIPAPDGAPRAFP